jgi:hypothetical protein
MANHLKTVAVFIAFTLSALPATLLTAQQTANPAPVPSQILAAKKVFISNAGGDELFYEDPLFDGGPDRAYNQFYTSMKTSGRYELVGAPADADLLLEIRFTIPKVAKDLQADKLIPAPYDPQLRLDVRDPKTNALLWAFTEHSQWALRQTNRDKNFDKAMAKLVSDVHGLNTQSPILTGAVTKP